MLVMAVGRGRDRPLSYDQSIPGARMQPPSAKFWMGTDNLSRDMWSRVVYGARISVTVGFATIAIGTLVAAAVGISSAYVGGDVRHRRAAHRRRLDVVPLPRHHPVADGRARAGALEPDLGSVVLIAAGGARVIRGAALSVMQNPTWRRRAPWARATSASCSFTSCPT